MLVSFRVGNYLSFKVNTEFSLETQSNRELIHSNTFHTAITDLRLNKSAALYGANSSGKSNLIKAIAFFVRFIRNSAKETQAQEEIQVVNFKLSTLTEDKPSFFEMNFLVEDLMYRYGFKVDRMNVHSEWLFSTKKIKESPLFERTFQKFELNEKFSEGRGLENKTRSNALFLSVVAQWNGKIATSIIEALRKIVFLSDFNDQIPLTSRLLDDIKYRKAILSFLNSIDLGFSDVKTETIKISSDDLGNMPEEIKKLILSKSQEEILVKTVHNKLDENNKVVGQVSLNLMMEESAGTQKIYSLAGFIIEALFNGKVLIIDEFTSRLHPLLARHIIKQFNSADTNTSGAQFVFASHNTYLMEQDLLRRDQIFLIRKNKQYSTEITTLYKEGVRIDSSYEKKYLEIGFNSLPNIQEYKLINDQLNLFDTNSD